MDLPQKFLEMHSDRLFKLFRESGPIVRIAPREPLGPVLDIEEATNEMITVITVRCVNDRGTVRFEGFSGADVEAARAWSKRHEHTTREEFNWLPSMA